MPCEGNSRAIKPGVSELISEARSDVKNARFAPNSGVRMDAFLQAPPLRRQHFVTYSRDIVMTGLQCQHAPAFRYETGRLTATRRAGVQHCTCLYRQVVVRCEILGVGGSL
jgi:hypothetical protein